MDYEKQNFIARIFQAVFSHKFLILSVTLLTVVSGMTATYLITPKYEASMTILISREKIDDQITTGDKGSGVIISGVSDEEFNSELELLSSNEVVLGAVKEMATVEYESPLTQDWASRFRDYVKGTTEKSPEKSAVQIEKADGKGNSASLDRELDRVKKGLNVTPTKDSRIIKITYQDVDPVRAKMTLEYIYKKYIALHLQMTEEPQIAEVFNEQSNNYGKKLNQSTDRLKKFDSTNNLTGTEMHTQQELLLKQYYDARAQLDQAATEITETTEKIKLLEKQVDEQPEQIQSGTVTKYVGALDQMKGELLKLEQERTQLMQKYQPTSRFVVDITERIEKLKKSIQNEQASPPQEKSFAVNELKRRLINDLYNAKTTLAALQERRKNLSSDTEKFLVQLKSLNGNSIEREKIERELKLNEEAYILYQKKARENEIGQTLKKNNLTNFTLVDPPYSSSFPVYPRTKLNFIALLSVGLFLGIIAAVFVEKTAERNQNDLVLSARELEERYDFPVLAVISTVALPLPEHISESPPEKKVTIRKKNFQPPRAKRLFLRS